jgi:hypothetical protein
MSNPGMPAAPSQIPANFAAMQGNGTNIRFMPNGAPIIANMSDMSTYDTTQWNNWEFVTQTLFDSAAYPAAGISSLTFFQVPQGGGTGFGGGSKTLSDTNMALNGQLPTGQMFVVSTVEIEFQPTTPTVTAGMPAVFGAQLVATQINDAYIFWRSGNAVFHILQKDYLQEAPLMRMPSQSDFSLQAALADVSTAGAGFQSRIAFASSYGPVYSLAPNNLLIPQTTNFFFRLAWPEGVQAITNPARIFVRLGGMQARQAQ